MNSYPPTLAKLIQYIKKLPGVGNKTAERFAFQLLDWNAQDLSVFASLLNGLQSQIKKCPTCFCLQEEGLCSFCDLEIRDTAKLCVIASAKDAYLIDETGMFKGLYHVLGGLLSPIQGKTVGDLELDSLFERVQQLQLKEVILALDSTLEGDTTSLFLKEQLQKRGISTSRLAFGIPMGSSLDFVDAGTLARALMARQNF